MDNKDKDLQEALDDIFGSDFIEIDNSSETFKNGESDFFEENNTNEPIVNTEDKMVNHFDYLNTENNMIDNETIKTSDLKTKEESKTIINDFKPEIKPIKKDEKTDNDLVKSNAFSKKILTYFLIGFALGFVIIFIFVNFVIGREKNTLCTMSAEDDGYKYADEYKITSKKGKIQYVESVYTYKALNDEYKKQIDFIKEEKLPVIINSNGMDGFTYIYELSDDYFKVSGYLDFSLFKYEEINKINQEVMPISYFKIKEGMNYKTLKQYFIKQGYKCVPTK